MPSLSAPSTLSAARIIPPLPTYAPPSPPPSVPLPDLPIENAAGRLRLQVSRSVPELPSRPIPAYQQAREHLRLRGPAQVSHPRACLITDPAEFHYAHISDYPSDDSLAHANIDNDKTIHTTIKDDRFSDSSYRIATPTADAPSFFDDTGIDVGIDVARRWPAKTCMVCLPCHHEVYRTPLKPDLIPFLDKWLSLPIHISASDVIIEREPRFEGVKWRMRLREDAPMRPLTQGTVIDFVIQNDPNTKYLATWKRWEWDGKASVEVVAYTSNKAVIEPHSTTWPSFLLIVPSRLCNVPFAPGLEKEGDRHRKRQRLEEEKYQWEHEAKHGCLVTAMRLFCPCLYAYFDN